MSLAKGLRAGKESGSTRELPRRKFSVEPKRDAMEIRLDAGQFRVGSAIRHDRSAGIAVIGGVIFFHERLHHLQWAGVCLVAVGLVMSIAG